MHIFKKVVSFLFYKGEISLSAFIGFKKLKSEKVKKAFIMKTSTSTSQKTPLLSDSIVYKVCRMV